MTSYVLLNDKVVANDILVARCCPSMDLLAIIQPSSITIHRFLNWQRLLSISNTNSSSGSKKPSIGGGNNTAIEWSPNGKIIAVGNSNGTITLYSIENGKELYHSNASSSSSSTITQLQWVQYQALNSTSTSKFNHSLRLNYFPPLSHFVDENSDSIGEIKPFPLRQDIDTFDILVSITNTGVISFYVFGIVFIGDFNILQLITTNSKYSNQHTLLKTTKSIDIKSTTFSSNFNLLNVMFETDTGLVAMLDIDTSIIGSLCNQIFETTYHVAVVEWLMDTLQDYLEDIEKRWKECQSTLQSRWSSFEKLLQDYGYSTSIEQELLDLLMTGIASPPTTQFILNNINIKNLKMILKTFEIIRESLIKYVSSSYAYILHTISHIQTLSIWKEKYQSILDTQKLTDLLTRSNQFGIQLERLETQLNEIENQYSSLFSWFQKVQNQLNDVKTNQNPQQQQQQQRNIYNELHLLELFEFGLNVDPFKPSKQNNNNNNNSKFNNNSNSNGKNNKDIWTQFNEFKEIVASLVRNVTNSNITSKFIVKTFTPICMYDKSKLSPNLQQFKSSSISINSKCIISFIIPFGSNNRIYIGSKDQEQTEWKFTFFQLETKDKVESLYFYNEEDLLVLVNSYHDEEMKRLNNSMLKSYQYGEGLNEQLFYQQLPVTIPPNTQMIDLLDATFFDETISESYKSRQIKLMKDPVPSPLQSRIQLHVSVQRKVTCILLGARRTLLLDLADDEEPEEEDAEEEGEEGKDEEESDNE